jgi:hypothetical protein
MNRMVTGFVTSGVRAECLGSRGLCEQAPAKTLNSSHTQNLSRSPRDGLTVPKSRFGG